MFLLQSIDSGHGPGFEYKTCGAITPKAGMALVMIDGELVAATGGIKPTYISLLEGGGDMEGSIIPVMRVSSSVVYSACTDADPAEFLPGQKAGISPDGMKLVTGEGAAEITAIDPENETISLRFV